MCCFKLKLYHEQFEVELGTVEQSLSLQQSSGIPRVSLRQQLRCSSLLLRRGSMMAILMVKYYLLPCIHYSERIEAARGGGVLLAVKTELLAYRRPDLEPQNSEILECGLVSPNSFKIIFCLCYSVANLPETTDRICIVGDFNVPTINWEYVIDLSNSTDGVKFCNLIIYHFVTQVVKEPTRISQSSKAILDLFFLSLS